MRPGIVASLLTTVLSGLSARAAVSGDADRLWAAHIQPLFAENCFKCHGNIETKSGLSLMSAAEVLRGGENGPAVIPGKPEKSLLFQYIQTESDPHMPPKGKQLAPEEIALIKRWIERLSPADAAAATNGVGNLASASRPSPMFHKPTFHPANGLAPSRVIDQLIEKRWRELNTQPSVICDDRAFCRRVYLDIAGRIPTPEELNRFLVDKSRDRRATLVNTLLDSPDYAVRMREVFDVVFMDRTVSQTPRQRRNNPAKPELANWWHDYLEWSFRENRPWNAIAREIVLARPATNEVRGAIQFLYARKDNAQQMAEASGSALLGLQLKCAQCHNHPLAPEIQQAHYWGLVAAFNRSKAVDTATGPGVGESAIGGFIKFTNLKAQSTDARVTFLDGTTVDEVRPKDGEKETDGPGNYANATPMGEGKNLKFVPVPKLSRREQFANWLVATNNPLLARAFVNRIWAMLLGRGLVHPVDRMDSSRPPSHPDLLDWLAEDFARNGYDVKRLIRTITATRVYQLDSRPAGKNRPAADTFACGLDKPLAAEVLARSMLVATGNEPEKESASELPELQKVFAEAFPEVFATENVSTLRQALFLSNNRNVDALTLSWSTNALARVASLQDKSKVKALFLRAFSREPDRAELNHSLAFLRARSEEPAAATQQLLWALLASAEFRINH